MSSATATPSAQRPKAETSATAAQVVPAGDVARQRSLDRFLAATRISIGWVFLWAFLDKTFALGFATGRDGETGVIDRFGDAAWINGANPTEGFLTFGLSTKQPFTDFYSSLAGQAWVDWAYMLSMLLIGLGLMTGIMTRIAAAGGAIWMLLFYSAGSIWPANNPVIDDHIVYAIVLAMFAVTAAGVSWGFGRWWRGRAAVAERTWLY